MPALAPVERPPDEEGVDVWDWEFGDEFVFEDDELDVEPLLVELELREFESSRVEVKTPPVEPVGAEIAEPVIVAFFAHSTTSESVLSHIIRIPTADTRAVLDIVTEGAIDEEPEILRLVICWPRVSLDPQDWV